MGLWADQQKSKVSKKKSGKSQKKVRKKVWQKLKKCEKSTFVACGGSVDALWRLCGGSKSEKLPKNYENDESSHDLKRLKFFPKVVFHRNQGGGTPPLVGLKTTFGKNFNLFQSFSKLFWIF